MDRGMIFYLWALSLLGALFLGNEIGMMKTDYIRIMANKKIHDCNQVIYGANR
jgi:hypothetical protein